MHFLEAGELLNVARDKIIDRQLWEKWLVELVIASFNGSEFKSFEEYKKHILNFSKLKSMTKEEKENDLNEIRKVAKKCIATIDPKNDLVRKKVDLRKKVSLKKKVKKCSKRLG